MSTRSKIFAGGIAVVLVAALGWWKYSGSSGSDGAGSGSESGGAAGNAAGGSSDSAPVREPARLTGTVKTAKGEPIAAVVQVNGDRRAETARAGADGSFSFADLEPGTYHVSASAPGFRPSVSAEIELAARATERVEMRLEPGGSPVVGRVVDISGGPIAGAFARLTPIAGILEPVSKRSFAAITGDDGTFELSAEDGVYLLEASHPDYVPNTERVEVRGASREIEIALIPGGVIEGVVIDAASGEPVGGARVGYRRSELTRIGGGPAIARQGSGGATTAKADGTFRLAGLEPGVISMTAAGGGKVSREPVAVSMGIAESRTGVEIYVDDGFHIRGVVVDQAGKPVAGADVNVSAEGGRGSATTDDGGRFDIGPLAPGSYGVFAIGGDIIGGFMSQTPVEIDAADVDGVKLEVRTGVRIRGRVEPAQIASVKIDLARSPARGGLAMMAALGGVQTDPDGEFELGPVEPGKTAALEAVSETGLRGAVEVEVTDSGADGVVIELGEAASIAGRVTNASGEPVAGVLVAASPGGPVRQRVIVNGAEISGRRATTGADGRYRIGGLEAGLYEVSVTDSLGQRLLWARPARKSAPTAPIEMELGEREKRQLDLSVKGLDGVIRGVVLGPDGRPAPDVFVVATPSRPAFADLVPGGPGPRRPPAGGGDRDARGEPDERSESVMMVAIDSGGSGLPISGSVPPVVTDAEGRFAITGLREGDYDLVAEGLGGTARAFADKVATGSEVKLQLANLTSLVGDVTRDGRPVTEFSVELTGPARHARSFRSDDGQFTMRRLDPGTYKLRVRGGGGETEMSVEIVAGKKTEVAVVLQSQLEVRGRLIDGDGNPVAKAMVLLAPAGPPGEVSIQIDSSSAPARSGEDGRFVVGALPGSYMLLALGGDTPRPLARKRVELSADVDVGDLLATGVDLGGGAN
jgi:protocatechuate 3,4-dioxygenase beta subunit